MLPRIVRIRGQWRPDSDIVVEATTASVEAEVKISRFDPSTDVKPHLDTYKVPLTKGMSVLGVLNYIQEKIDPSLAYYYSCRRGRCGGCTARVNGRNTLVCNSIACRKMIIEPIPGLEIARDLIVNQKKR